MSYQEYRDKCDASPQDVRKYLEAAIEDGSLSDVVVYRHLRFIATRYCHLMPNARIIVIGADPWNAEQLSVVTPQCTLLLQCKENSDSIEITTATLLEHRLLFGALRSMGLAADDSRHNYVTAAQLSELFNLLWDFSS